MERLTHNDHGGTETHPNSDPTSASSEQSTANTDDSNNKNDGLEPPTRQVSAEDHPQQTNDGHQEDKSQLQSALQELESERAKRQELEETIALLKEEQQKQHEHRKTQKKKRRSSSSGTASTDSTTKDESKSQSNNSRKEFVALQAKVDGYRQLVDALTMGRPAMVAATTAMAQHQPNALPLHIMRFLELMPWHPQALRAAVVMEEIYEWQVYHPTKKSWRSEVAHFPTFFQALPLACPSWNGREIAASNAEGVLSLPTTNDKVGVWTDEHLSHRFELRDGYHLSTASHAPRWKWVGGWHVDIPVEKGCSTRNATAKPETADGSCLYDKDGWSYAREAGHFVESSSGESLLTPASVASELTRLDYTQHRHSHDESVHNSMVRRRKWHRKRVLVDYPFASECTQNYLKLIVEREEMTVATAKLHRQWNENRRALNTMEVQYARDHQLWTSERQKLEKQKQELEAKIKKLEHQLEREKGPHHFNFFSPTPKIPAAVKTLDASDSDSEDSANAGDDCISHCSSVTNDDDDHDHVEEVGRESEQLHSKPLLLHPEDGTDSRRRETDDSTKPSLFGWIHPALQQHKSTASPKEHLLHASSLSSKLVLEAAPEVEACSDGTSSSLSSSNYHGNDDGLSHFSTSPPLDELKKSFLHFHLFQK